MLTKLFIKNFMTTNHSRQWKSNL